METTNIWGILVVPIGVVICFGPALLVWLRAERNDPASKAERKP